MKTLAATIDPLFFLLFVVTTFVPFPAARDTATDAGFSAEQIDQGRLYSFQRRVFLWTGTALELGLLYCLAMTGVARRLADRFLAWTGERRILAALGMGAVYLVLHKVLFFPLSYARLEHANSWGMSNLEFLGWLRDYAMSFGINTVWQAIVLVGSYALLIGFPRTWWLLAPVGGTFLGMGYAFLAP